MKHKKGQNKTARDMGFQGWNDVAVWWDFKPIYISEDIWPHYLEHVTSERSHDAHSPVLATGIGQFMAR